MANWTRHAYPGELAAADRLTWYETIGIKDLFSAIDQTDSTDNGTDTFKVLDLSGTYPSTAPQIALKWLTNANTAANKPVIKSYAIGTTSSSCARISVTGIPDETSSPLYIDTLIHGDLTLVRFTYEYARNNITFIFFNDENIDGDTVAVSIGGALSNWSTSNNTSWASMYYSIDTTYTNKSSIAGTYFINNNLGTCNKVIVQPLAIQGVNAGLYSIDGGSAPLAYNTDFMVDGVHFYHIGYGICIKITS